ncbi:BnaC03g21840D [Brassica napus]|uniref:BnaC03g21840D protein n=2 Tax=Brassica napus TaxID=3708 RepID=A0A078FMV4_BRANA|nr:BnaC03g21840D [Brassica napus]
MGEVGNASDQSEDNVATGVLVEKEESEGQQEHLSSALSSQKENEESLPVEDPTVGGLDEPEAKCSVSESDVKGDGKKCVGTSESADLDSEAPKRANQRS